MHRRADKLVRPIGVRQAIVEAVEAGNCLYGRRRDAQKAADEQTPETVSRERVGSHRRLQVRKSFTTGRVCLALVIMWISATQVQVDQLSLRF